MPRENCFLDIGQRLLFVFSIKGEGVKGFRYVTGIGGKVLTLLSVTKGEGRVKLLPKKALRTFE